MSEPNVKTHSSGVLCTFLSQFAVLKVNVEIFCVTYLLYHLQMTLETCILLFYITNDCETCPILLGPARTTISRRY